MTGRSREAEKFELVHTVIIEEKTAVDYEGQGAENPRTGAGEEGSEDYEGQGADNPRRRHPP